MDRDGRDEKASDRCRRDRSGFGLCDGSLCGPIQSRRTCPWRGLLGAGTGALIGAIPGGGHGAGIGAAVGGGLKAVAGAATMPTTPPRPSTVAITAAHSYSASY